MFASAAGYKGKDIVKENMRLKSRQESEDQAGKVNSKLTDENENPIFKYDQNYIYSVF